MDIDDFNYKVQIDYEQSEERIGEKEERKEGGKEERKHP